MSCHGVVGDFGANDALVASLAPLGLLLGRGATPADVVGQERGDVGAGARNGADDRADQARAHRRPGVTSELLERRHHAPDLGRDAVRSLLRQHAQNLGQAEQPDQDRDVADAVLQDHGAEGIARHAMDQIEADERDQQPDPSRDPALQRPLADDWRGPAIKPLPKGAAFNRTLIE